MKGRTLVLVLVTLVGMAALLYGRQAQARAEPLLAIDNVFTAVNSGNVESALTSFSENAIAEDQVRGETYRGASEIQQMLQSMHHNGRRFDIMAERADGDVVTAQVEVSDRGIVWGTETIVAEVKDGKLRSFNVTSFRLELSRIGQ